MIRRVTWATARGFGRIIRRLCGWIGWLYINSGTGSVGRIGDSRVDAQHAEIEFDVRGMVEIRTAAGMLVFKYDPLRDLVEVKTNGKIELIDLRPIRAAAEERYMVQGKSV